MVNVRRILAKPEIITIEDEEGKKEFKVYPLTNRQLLEIMELGKAKEDSQSSINIVLKIFELSKITPNYQNESPLVEEELRDLPTPFLIKLLKDILKLNGLEEMFDFQAREQGKGLTTPNPSQPESTKNTFEVLNRNPVKKIS